MFFWQIIIVKRKRRNATGKIVIQFFDQRRFSNAASASYSYYEPNSIQYFLDWACLTGRKLLKIESTLAKRALLSICRYYVLNFPDSKFTYLRVINLTCMKLHQSILKEVIILVSVYVLCWLLIRIAFQFFNLGVDSLDIWLNQEKVIIGMAEISIVTFIFSGSLIYFLRFLLAKPRAIFTGIIATILLIITLVCLEIYTPLYQQFRQLTVEHSLPLNELNYNDFGMPVFDDHTREVLSTYDQERETSILLEVRLAQIFNLILIVCTLLLLISCWRKRSRETLNQLKE